MDEYHAGVWPNFSAPSVTISQVLLARNIVFLRFFLIADAYSASFSIVDVHE